MDGVCGMDMILFWHVGKKIPWLHVFFCGISLTNQIDGDTGHNLGWLVGWVC